ncbi:chascon [Anaeramoeba flamelloides]|uniref:Chascon n=1 Tax=Anaeramoeba flamelloides TaxID=1746091 RepID=A0ABQ8ZEZ3_9EUKA|nr:chascon [Anaeramoeba flamelloides]
MNELQKTRSEPLPIQPNNTDRITIRSQSDLYFNRFSRPDLIQPQPKKNFPSQRFKSSKFQNYDFTKELTQFISPINEFIEMSLESITENQFQQQSILKELPQFQKNQNTFPNKQEKENEKENKKENEKENENEKEKKEKEKENENEKEKEKEKEKEQEHQEQELEEEGGEEITDYERQEKEQYLAFSPPRRSKCPLWQDNKFRRMLSLDYDYSFEDFENNPLENMY